VTRSFRAEWLKLLRPAVVLGAGGALFLLASLATILTFAGAAKHVSRAPLNNPPLLSTTTQLAAASGVSRGFIIAAGFIGILVFVLFTANIASEFSQGTLRTLLTRQPKRAHLLVGKVAALLTASALALAAVFAVSIALSFALAAIRGISTTRWLSTAGATEIGRAYGNTLLTVALFAILGVALGLVVRATVPAVAIGVAWMLPLEHIVQGVWIGAGRWFPGLLLDAITREGNAVASYRRAIILAVVYASAFAAIGVISFLRRDVTT
jgi:ABC-2 type transport system permease protein